MKRGQVTYFIIAGLIILIAVIMILSARFDLIKNFYEEQRTKLVGVPAEIAPVENYIQECLDEVSNTGVKFVLLQGGYYDPINNVDLDSFKVAYWIDGKAISPPLKIIQNEISKFIDSSINECILAFPDINYKITPTKSRTQTIIKEKLILIKIKYNTNVEYKDITYTLNSYNTNLNLDITKIIEDGKKIVQMEIDNQNELDISLLETLDYKIDIFPHDRGLIYSLSNNQTTLMFAVK